MFLLLCDTLRLSFLTTSFFVFKRLQANDAPLAGVPPMKAAFDRAQESLRGLAASGNGGNVCYHFLGGLISNILVLYLFSFSFELWPAQKCKECYADIADELKVLAEKLKDFLNKTQEVQMAVLGYGQAIGIRIR